MAKWKLKRHLFGNEEYTFSESAQITVGRGVHNKISLSSIVVSRNHCVIDIKDNNVTITDLKSSNGVYVGLKKIPPNTPVPVKESDIIGIGWTKGAPVANINDQEKFMYQLVMENKPTATVDKIIFQEELDERKPSPTNTNASILSPIIETKPQLKRKLDEQVEVKIKKANRSNLTENEVIHLLSDSDTDCQIMNNEISYKKLKMDPIKEEVLKDDIKDENIKTENEDIDYNAFRIKQEYMGFDDEAIQCDSDSDSESEHWLMRLSQSSPGKAFTKITRRIKSDVKTDENSYSQLDDDEFGDVCEDDNDIVDEEYEYDLISIPPEPLENTDQEKHIIVSDTNLNNPNNHKPQIDAVEEEEYVHDIITLNSVCQSDEPNNVNIESSIINQPDKDMVDGFVQEKAASHLETAVSAVVDTSSSVKQAQMIEALVQLPKKKSHYSIPPHSKHKHSSAKHSRHKRHSSSSSKKHISHSQKEERKKKLKEIATSKKDVGQNKCSSHSKPEKAIVNAKVTSSNRGAFLTDVGIVKPIKRKESPQKSSSQKQQTKMAESSPRETFEKKVSEPKDDTENKKKHNKKHKIDKHKSSKSKEKLNNPKDKSIEIKPNKNCPSESRVPLKSLKLPSETEESFSGKPFSKVKPLPPKKPTKAVRFSTLPPKVHVFEIEFGNKLKKTSLAKTMQVEKHTPRFSLEKMTLLTILRWNPQWLDEQENNKEPPPILGHNNLPMTILHAFNNHKQYVQVVGDLLLMEIWECLTQGYSKVRNQPSNDIPMRIASKPPAPIHNRVLELYNISVDVSVLNSDVRKIPRMGEIIIIAFGPENGRSRRFFYVHHVKILPSPPNNKYSFFCIYLQSCYTDRMDSLKPGELIIAVSLSYIQKELMLFEAMEYLGGSPLSEAILKPELRHFIKAKPDVAKFKHNKWTSALNASQQTAVISSVAAALGDRPCIQMVQGPPGTGKSSVICSIVMSYFFDEHGKKQPKRGKVLICATSNAAVDELVIRLLNIRQGLPKTGRFRMVRVGRAEAMHPKAFDVSSQQLAQRDAARARDQPSIPGIDEEISHLEAKINMWRTQALDAKDSARVAYCQQKVNQLITRIGLLQSGGSGKERRADQLAETERRIIEMADIVITTLASAQNPKMRGIKGQIALCIIDEAGQAIEPETLIPLTLDVTRLTLIGDPQQLPGFICSQRAKRHGLGESLFSRLASCAENWPEGSPVVLLDQQYRMHADIADYPNRAFYAGLIKTVPLRRPTVTIPPYVIVGISSGDKGQGASGANEMEAWGVSRLVVTLNIELRARRLVLAVITPYNAHKELIKRNLRTLQEQSEPQIEVNTVDSFQGQERDVVVVSLARSQGVGFLTDSGRMNVMLTRARHSLIICLNPNALLKNQQWRSLVEDAQRRHMYKVLPSKMCQPCSPGQLQCDEILKYVTNGK